MNFKQIGLEGVFLTEAFNKGLNEYQRGLAAAEKATTQVAGSINAAAGSLGGEVGSAAEIAGIGLSTFATVAITACAAVVGAIGGVVVAAMSLAQIAAVNEDLETSFATMASNIGLSLEDLQKATRGTIAADDLYKMANKALIGAGDELGQMLGDDLPKMFEIARAAAKATGMDVEKAMGLITTSVKRGTSRGLLQLGLTVDAKAAAAEYADATGELVGEMATEDKQIAMLNAIMKAGQPIVDQWGQAPLTAAENIKAAKASFENIGDTLGGYFLPALNTVWAAIGRFAKVLEEATKEGGSLYPILVKLGAVISIVADGFSAGVDAVIGIINGLIGNVSGTFEKTASDAFEWGANIISQLAQGIIDGAATAINAVAEAVNGLLSYWFAPGSPPKVAPDIDKWGAGTMDAYLHAFSEADFGILKDLQSPIKEAMSQLAEDGKAIGPAWAKVSKSISKALASGDLTKAYGDIAKVTGKYASEIVLLAKDEWALKQSTDALTAAELRLKNAKQGSLDANAKVSKSLREYNTMLRAGASKEVLAAKLKEIQAAEAQAKAADKEVLTASEGVDTAKLQNDQMKDQLALQKQIIDQILDLNKAQKEKDKLAKEAGGGKQPLKPAGGGGKGAAPPKSPQEALNKAIEDAKKAIEEKLKGLWDSIVTGLNEKLKPLQEAWENLKKAFQPFLDWIKGPAKTGWDNFWKGVGDKVDEVTTWVGKQIKWATDLWNGWWRAHGKSVKIIWDKIQKALEPVAEFLSKTWAKIQEEVTKVWSAIGEWLGKKWEELKKTLQGAWDAMGKLLSTAWENMKKTIKTATDLIGKGIDTFATLLTTDWNKLWDDIKKKVKDIWDEIKKKIKDTLDDIKTKLDTWKENFKSAINGVWDEIKTAAETGWDNIIAAIKAKIDSIVGAGSTFVSDMVDIGKKLVQGIWDGFKEKWDEFVSAIQNFANGLPDWVKKILGLSTDTDTNKNTVQTITNVFADIGKKAMEGLALGMASASIQPIGVAKATAQALVPAMATTTVNTRSISNTSSVNMGGVNINNGMELASLISLINRVVSQRMQS